MPVIKQEDYVRISIEKADDRKVKKNRQGIIGSTRANSSAQSINISNDGRFKMLGRRTH